MSELATLASTIFKHAGKSERFIVAVAGPPASGKTTRAQGLVELMPNAAAVYMDGFHYDDRVLAQMGLSQRKGAPETFDFGGFLALLKRIRAREENIAIPTFDRELELSRNAASIISREIKFIIVEGNYLLLDEEPWNELGPLFDFTIFVDVPREELDRRLVERWRSHGRDDQSARLWINSNDLVNIDRVQTRRRKADLVL